MNTKKRFSMGAAVPAGMLVALLALFSMAGCEIITGLVDGSREFFHDEEDLGPVPDTSIFANRTLVVWPRGVYDSLASMPIGLVHSTEISLSADGQKVQIGKFPSYTGYDEHDPAEEPAYQVLKDFLLLPGVEEEDTISFDAKGKIRFFCKYGPQNPANSGNYVALYDMVIVIGTGHGTTPGAGQLNPGLFARTVELSGWPDTDTDSTPDGDVNKTNKVSGKKLSKGSVLILHGWPSVTVDTVPYYIYSDSPTHNVPFNNNHSYVY
jgi:hypothetical protein